MSTITKRLILGMPAAAKPNLLLFSQRNGFAIGVSELELTADKKRTVFHALDLCHGFNPTSP